MDVIESLKTMSVYEFFFGNVVNIKISEMSLCFRWLSFSLSFFLVSSRAARFWVERGVYCCFLSSRVFSGARSGFAGRAYWLFYAFGRCDRSGGFVC